MWNFIASVRKAASLKKEHGILPKVSRKKGHQLDDDVLNFVKQFYEDDEYSRMCPEAKEYKSMTTDGVKRKKLKRLLLVNIKELYLEFRKKYINNSQGNDNPQIHTGLSKFFSLIRPKWVVTASDSCMNNVCVWAIYQNVKLMTHAVPSNDTYKNLLEKLVSGHRQPCLHDETVWQMPWNYKVTWLSHRSFPWWRWWRWSNCFLQILLRWRVRFYFINWQCTTAINLLKNWF